MFEKRYNKFVLIREDSCSKKNYKLKIIIHENSWTFMDIRVKIKHTQRKKLLILPISFWPRQMSVFSLFTFHYSLNIIRVLKKHPDGFLLSTKCVFFRNVVWDFLLSFVRTKCRRCCRAGWKQTRLRTAVTAAAT